jgi:hypothetical protein
MAVPEPRQGRAACLGLPGLEQVYYNGNFPKINRILEKIQRHTIQKG